MTQTRVSLSWQKGKKRIKLQKHRVPEGSRKVLVGFPEVTPEAELNEYPDAGLVFKPHIYIYIYIYIYRIILHKWTP